MKSLRCLLVAAALAGATLATPILTSAAEAGNVTANQIAAAGHNRRPTMTNRPARQMFHRHSYGRPYGHYGRSYGYYGRPYGFRHRHHRYRYGY